MSALILLALLAPAVGVAVCAAVIAYLLGYDNGYLRARRELHETRARSVRRTPAILGATRRIERDDG